MSGKGTTTIERPAVPPRASDRGRSRLGDLSRPIPVDRRIARRRRSNVLLALVAVGIAAALGAALFVLPVQTLLQQDEQIAERTEQLDQLRAVNDDLRTEVARLRTDDGIREAAREQLGYVEQGEVRMSVLEFPPVPTDLPDGWPYSLVEGITALRRTGPVTAAPAPATVPATVPATAPAVAPATVPATAPAAVPATAPATNAP